MILRYIQLNCIYKENEEEINNIIKENKLSYEEAKMKHIDIFYNEIRNEIDNESRCIITHFQHELGRYDNVNCLKVCLDCNNELDYVGEPIENIISVGCQLNYNEYKKLNNDEKKKLVLKIIVDGFEKLNRKYNWDLTPVYRAIEVIKEKKYINRGQFLKTKSNKSRSHKAKLLFNHELDKIELFLSISNKLGEEIKRVKVIETEPVEWYYSTYLGDIKWLSNNDVVLYDTNKIIYWSESIIDSNNSNITKEIIEQKDVINNEKNINIADKISIDCDSFEEEFWRIITMLDWKYEGNDEKVIKPAITYLSKKSNEEIYMFCEILSKLLYDLDGFEYAKNIGDDSYVNDDEYFSVDNFLYVRCCVIANGKEYYYKVLNTPEKMPKDLEFEPLLYIADEAYELKNSKELNYFTKYSYETFINSKKWKFR